MIVPRSRSYSWLGPLKREYPSLTVHVVVTSGGNEGSRRCGLVTQAIEEDLGELTGWRVYLCGSPPMVEAAKRLVCRKGVAREHIYADAFYTQGECRDGG
jgi:naphthalene 1,2-dioxygenase ferredoxin reductase component